MLVYAGPDVIKAFTLWSKTLPADEEAPRLEWRASHIRFEALVRAMRKDLGTSNFGLAEEDLLRAVIDDWDVYSRGEVGEPGAPEGEPRVTDNRSPVANRPKSGAD